MKKLVSTILSVSMAAVSAAVPVFADYTEPENDNYDVAWDIKTFDDGTEINNIDDSRALKLTEQTNVIEFNAADLMFNKEFFLSMDVRYDEVDGTYPGIIGISRSGKTGPQIKYNAETGQMVNERSGGSDNLGAIEADTWYTIEFEGKMSVTGAAVTFRLYGYAGGEKTLIQETPNLNLRNFYGGTTHGNANYAYGTNGISVDNVQYIALNPNEIAISATAEEISAGGNSAFDYTMYRDDTEVYKHNVTWSVYDEDNESMIEDGSVAINDSGILIADISSPTQTVTVRATVVFGDKELVGTKQISIKAVDTDSEKFDAIEIDGESAVKAGTTSTYTFTASKNGEDVTSDITDGDVEWAIYSFDGLYKNEVNSTMNIENGVLTIGDGVLPQNITIRASSKSGNVYGNMSVTIDGFADSQAERGDIYYNAFENEFSSSVNRAVSVDGSTAYLVTAADDIWQVANHSEYLLTELDIKFTAAGSGITLMRRDGAKTNTSITYSGGNLVTYSGVLMSNADMDSWYHIELLYSSANADASCNIYKYNDDGTLGEVQSYLNINMRNAADYGRFRIEAGSCVDNLKISTPVANEVSITAPGQYMFAGETAQFSATAARNGLPLKGATGLEWKVLDAEMLPILDGSVTVDDNGLVTVDAMTPAQTITVQVSTATGATAKASIIIQVSEVFSVTNLGINEAGTAITKLYADKNFYYNDDVIFIITIKGEDGVLKAVKLISTFGDRLNLGSNELAADLPLPADFDPETDRVEAMVWTSF